MRSCHIKHNFDYVNEITFKISSLKKTGQITPTSPGTDKTRLSTTAHLRQARTSPRPWRHRTIPHGEVRSMRGTFQAHGITSLDRMASMLSVGSTHPDPGWRVDSWWKTGASWKKVWVDISTERAQSPRSRPVLDLGFRHREGGTCTLLDNPRWGEKFNKSFTICWHHSPLQSWRHRISDNTV